MEAYAACCWLRFFRAFSSAVRQLPGCTSQKRGTVRTLPKLIVLLHVLFVLIVLFLVLFVLLVLLHVLFVLIVLFYVLFVLIVYRTTATGGQTNCN